MSEVILKTNPVPAAAWVAWATTLGATAASVYFIEILGNPAATLCWVDRMLMLGLLLNLTVGLARRDTGVWRYTLPFLFIGLPLSLYQQLVHWDIINLATQACSVSYVCSTKFFNLFGFISQATLCLAAFLVVAVCMWIVARSRSTAANLPGQSR